MSTSLITMSLFAIGGLVLLTIIVKLIGITVIGNDEVGIGERHVAI